MDETAFPILLLDLLRREAPYAIGKLDRWWPMVRSAVSFILRNGPVTQQDRWKEDAGYSPFTLAAEISGLLAAADIADLTGHSEQAVTMRDTADALERQHRALGLRHRRRSGRATWAFPVTTCASLRRTLTSPEPHRPRKASFPSRIVRRGRMEEAIRN